MANRASARSLWTILAVICSAHVLGYPPDFAVIPGEYGAPGFVGGLVPCCLFRWASQHPIFTSLVVPDAPADILCTSQRRQGNLLEALQFGRTAATRLLFDGAETTGAGSICDWCARSFPGSPCRC